MKSTIAIIFTVLTVLVCLSLIASSKTENHPQNALGLVSEKFTEGNHSYILFSAPGTAGKLNVAHDPDCKCQNKNKEVKP